MKRGRINVEVADGVFETERSVSIQGMGQVYQLLVDRHDVEDGRLKVGVLDESHDSILISLPRDTFTSGSTVRVPRATVELE